MRISTLDEFIEKSTGMVVEVRGGSHRHVKWRKHHTVRLVYRYTYTYTLNNKHMYIIAISSPMSLLINTLDYAGNNYAWRIINLYITWCSAPTPRYK